MPRSLTQYDIPYDRWISREELCKATGQSDRSNRADIHKLRREGVVVLSTSTGNGYKLATEEDRELVEACRKETYNRAIETMSLLKTFDKWLARPINEQLEFPFF